MSSHSNLADRIPDQERTIEGDRRFFERHPDRSHRVRLASKPEIRQLEDVHGGALILQPGDRLYVVIRQIAPGSRIRHFLANEAGLDTDLPEETCRRVFDRQAPSGGPVAKAEKAIREVLAARGRR